MLRRLRPAAVMIALSVLLVGGGCSRPTGSSGSSTTASPNSSARQQASPTGQPAGAFGDLGRICGPGTPAAAPVQRGLTASSIRLGTIGDPGAAAAPGLEQEYFDVGKAFVAWCNRAGGINGRKLVLDTYDAQLFNGAEQILAACQRDFMLVGNGNAFDAADVRPRLACHLGQIPALSVSPEAGTAGLQVQPTSNNPAYYGVGQLRALADAYPAAKSGLAIGSSNVSSLSPQGRFAKQAYESLGYKVTTVQEKPPLVDNFRPYMEQLRASGARAYDEIASQDPAPEVNAMAATGWHPQFVLWSIQFYDPKSVAAARNSSVPFPPSYVALGNLPFELAADYPVLRQIKDMMSATIAHPKYTSFTALAVSAWALWAASATACGADLSQDCILAKAGAHTDWTAGGLMPAHSTVPGKQIESDCFILVRLTPSGFVYDRTVTRPNQDIFNCSPDNLVKVTR